jgi:hypothetical protein
MESDAAYFRRRASEEYVACASAAHSAARRSHLELGRRYEDLAWAIDAQEHRLGINPRSAAEDNAEASHHEPQQVAMWL